jgi:hypothetical protein
MRHREPILVAKADIGMAICGKETDPRTPLVSVRNDNR